mmetsp:Transcript_10501/g.21094  ORF Transcript_10501/g.21094 Transcript_10501/m.21094 type:complete len:188 (-) Transcript_10501:407-970(-)
MKFNFPMFLFLAISRTTFAVIRGTPRELKPAEVEVTGNAKMRPKKDGSSKKDDNKMMKTKTPNKTKSKKTKKPKKPKKTKPPKKPKKAKMMNMMDIKMMKIPAPVPTESPVAPDTSDPSGLPSLVPSYFPYSAFPSHFYTSSPTESPVAPDSAWPFSMFPSHFYTSFPTIAPKDSVFPSDAPVEIPP